MERVEILMSISINTSRIEFFWKESQKIPHSCDVCGFMFRDQEDFKSFKTLGACTECIDTYYYPNADAWEKGWRPNLEKKDDNK